jgi:hypothetical protein
MHSTGTRRRGLPRVRTLIALLAVMIPVAALGIASPAMAEPKGIFKIFSDCPTTEPGVTICNFAETTSGEFAIGKTAVPINKPIVLQGGGIPTGNPENENEYFLVPAKDGNSLSKVELNVPGGLLDLINCEEIKGSGFFEIIERGTCKAIFENKTTGVTATTELVANTKNPAILNLPALTNAKETGITLPVRVHLKNPLLGNSCYVGSESSPIQLHLTTGTSGTLKGKVGTVETPEEKGWEFIRLKNNSLVDNTFTAPVAEGCGEFFSFLIDPVVDSKLGLPSAAGNNKAILSGTLNTAVTEAVIASESF